MISEAKYQFAFKEIGSSDNFSKGLWLVVLHASRIPPHVGLMFNGNYNSLTIKEQELNVSKEALLKTISQRKIDALFFKIVKHPVFSTDYQLQVFQEQVKKYNYVEQGVATCLSPLKLFFEEFYAIKNNNMLFYDFLEVLNENDFISDVIGINVKTHIGDGIFKFETYSTEQLESRIKEERSIYYKK